MDNPGNGDNAISDETLCSALGAIPGLDPVVGLRHLRGRADSYLRLLRKFAETRAADIEAMQRCLSTQDHAELASLAHNLKGVSGFLGAIAVEALASETHAALRIGRDKSEIARLVSALIDAQSDLAKGMLALPLAKPDE